MKSQNGLSLQSSLLDKSLFALKNAVTRPRSSASWILRGHLAKDKVFVEQTCWFTGMLPRVPLACILPVVEELDVVLPRVFDRKSGTSITAEEACHLAAIAKGIKAKKALEIGTYDGNTALVLAANLTAEGEVVTVDLPADFGAENRTSLTYSDSELNLTERNQLGRQCRWHRLSPRIRQVYGDSAALDWSALGGPFNLIFIDGCHSEAYVREDSRNALDQLVPGGAIVWHDYGAIPGVSAVVDRLAGEGNKRMRVFALEGTRLAVALT